MAGMGSASGQAPPPPPPPPPAQSSQSPSQSSQSKRASTDGSSAAAGKHSAVAPKHRRYKSQVRFGQVLHCDELRHWLRDVMYYGKRPNGIAADAPFAIADYGPGWNPEVPMFVARELSQLVQGSDEEASGEKKKKAVAAAAVAGSDVVAGPPPIVYCLDLHMVRMQNLFNQSLDEGLERVTRVVVCKLETMGKQAQFTANQAAWLAGDGVEAPRTHIDAVLASEERVVDGRIELGVLCNDMIGFLDDYYKAYSDMLVCMQSVRATICAGGRLVVTQPCMLHQVDNIRVLEECRFRFIAGVDVDLPRDVSEAVTRDTPLDRMSRLHHYTVLVFEAV